MKQIESYIDAARNFNSNLESDSSLKVVEKPKIENNSNRGFTEYAFSDGVIVRHSWNGNTYFGHKDYDHSVEVVNNAGYEFEKTTLSYNMQNSQEL